MGKIEKKTSIQYELILHKCDVVNHYYVTPGSYLYTYSQTDTIFNPDKYTYIYIYTIHALLLIQTTSPTRPYTDPIHTSLKIDNRV